MKRIFSNILFALILSTILLLISCGTEEVPYDITDLTKITDGTYDEMGLVWIIEPELDYGSINACSKCTWNLFNFENDDITDMKTTLENFRSPDDENNIRICRGHGYTIDIYFYDETKALFAIFTDDTIPFFLYYTPDEFSKRGATLYMICKIDLDKVICDENIWLNDWCELNKEYIGDKYAVAYGATFITDFIYDYEIKTRSYQPNKTDYIDLIYNGKWGVLDKNGNVAVPFIFDDIEFINHENTIAFAKYNGKYGILDVQKTALNNATTDSLQTTDNISD